jgi:tetratricopeptide (TPR) repeat protein
VTLGLAVTLLSSCAYYNTFYLARKYYFKATDGAPYEVDRNGTTQRANYNKSSDYSKKLLGVYPKSKWVDDAWMLWARSLIGTDDPLKAIAMLEEFQVRFPKSELRPDAQFFLGLAYDAARKHEQAVAHFDEFLKARPKDELAPYAYYERSKALMSLENYKDAAASAGKILERWPGHVLADRALRQRAEARFQQHAWKEAREDFEAMGSRATNDDDRMVYLLREVDCLEASREYDDARRLLADARAHVPAPPPVPELPRVGSTPSVPPPVMQSYVSNTPGAERYGRLTLRMGGVELLAGRTKDAIDLYQTVLHDYPRSQLASEAQYRIGYAYETGADDFTRASVEYARVKEQAGTSQFSQQAQQRMDNLDRIQSYRTATGADSAEKQAEASFLVAEHYLFNLERPERAVEQYRAIADSNGSPSVKARAMNAEAWVLSRKLDRKPAADSLFWKVVREFPQTEAQLAARDYLEMEGNKVPESLIVPPPGLVAPPRPAVAEQELTSPPAITPALGSAGATDPSAGHFHAGAPPAVPFGAAGAGAASSYSAPYPGHSQPYRNAQLPDSVKHVLAARDSMLRVAAQDTSAAGQGARGFTAPRVHLRRHRGPRRADGRDPAGHPGGDRRGAGARRRHRPQPLGRRGGRGEDAVQRVGERLGAGGIGCDPGDADRGCGPGRRQHAWRVGGRCHGRCRGGWCRLDHARAGDEHGGEGDNAGQDHGAQAATRRAHQLAVGDAYQGRAGLDQAREVRGRLDQEGGEGSEEGGEGSAEAREGPEATRTGHGARSGAGCDAGGRRHGEGRPALTTRERVPGRATTRARIATAAPAARRTWRQVRARVVSQRESGAGFRWLELELPAGFVAPVAGQFVSSCSSSPRRCCSRAR